MAIQGEPVAAAPLVGGGETTLHSHPGGGAVIKSGLVVGLVDGGSQAVSFGAAFATSPRVVACLASNIAKADIIRVYDISATGFTVAILKDHTGGGDTWDVAWIATDAGG